MSPYDDLSGGQVRRTALSKKELQRGGVMARVKAGELRLKDAAELMRVTLGLAASQGCAAAAARSIEGNWLRKQRKGTLLTR